MEQVERNKSGKLLKQWKDKAKMMWMVGCSIKEIAKRLNIEPVEVREVLTH